MVSGDLGKLLQGDALRGQMNQVQSLLKSVIVEGTSGSGAVRVAVTGDLEVSSVTIDPSVLIPDRVHELEKLIVESVNAGLANARMAAAQQVAKLLAGL